MKKSLWTCLLISLGGVLSGDPPPRPLYPARAADLSQIDQDLFNALKEEDFDAAATTLKNGANINAISPGGQQTPLMQNVLHGRAQSVKFCLENNADTTIAERSGYTPMHGAGFQGRAEIAQLLKDHDVGLRDKHSDGYEPAIRACWGRDARHVETLAWFLDNGVPVKDISEICLKMAKNEQIRDMITQRLGEADEL